MDRNKVMEELGIDPEERTATTLGLDRTEEWIKERERFINGYFTKNTMKLKFCILGMANEDTNGKASELLKIPATAKVYQSLFEHIFSIAYLLGMQKQEDIQELVKLEEIWKENSDTGKK